MKSCGTEILISIAFIIKRERNFVEHEEKKSMQLKTKHKIILVSV